MKGVRSKIGTAAAISILLAVAIAGIEWGIGFHREAVTRERLAQAASAECRWNSSRIDTAGTHLAILIEHVADAGTGSSELRWTLLAGEARYIFGCIASAYDDALTVCVQEPGLFGLEEYTLLLDLYQHLKCAMHDAEWMFAYFDAYPAVEIAEPQRAEMLFADLQFFYKVLRESFSVFTQRYHDLGWDRYGQLPHTADKASWGEDVLNLEIRD